MRRAARPGRWVDIGLPGRCARFDADWSARLVAAGLLEPRLLLAPRPPGPGTGRGPAARVALPDGAAVFVKQALRGGLLARFNRDRYVSRRRFLRDLDLARRALEAGCPVVPWVGLVCERAHPGWRAWLASPFVDGGVDLARRLAASDSEREALQLWRAALHAVGRMHRGGLHHRDLNLGNLVARRSGTGWEVVVIDVDGGRFFPGGVPPRRRRRALERLRRSWRKILGDRVPLPAAVRDRELERAAAGALRT